MSFHPLFRTKFAGGLRRSFRKHVFNRVKYDLRFNKRRRIRQARNFVGVLLGGGGGHHHGHHGGGGGRCPMCGARRRGGYR